MLVPVQTVPPGHPYFVLQLDEGSRDFVGHIEITDPAESTCFVELPSVSGRLQVVMPSTSAPGSGGLAATVSPVDLVKSGHAIFKDLGVVDPVVFETDKPFTAIQFSYATGSLHRRISVRFRPDGK